ncbi:hypothetical protein GM3708_1160 [Geminocystis sp. NIES-3708]|uniref:hypothetical protein n=1 Tax=Geminocystis sp. NIES-3708 TaxID=1615909 RepID=UPI0005FCB039|nr:hypothetical protein [Geminocystis sp. NIES-3708]BAQ60754.1 hypothetical protein GM3708_1160 [Geminocystis sp. NIES-3708]
MLIIPLLNRQLKETYELNLQQEINQNLLLKLKYISQSDSYNHHLKMSCYNAIKLLEKMNKDDLMTK